MNHPRRLGNFSHSLIVLGAFLTSLIMIAPAEGHNPGIELSGFGTPTIDGVIALGEWDDAGQISFNVNVPEGGSALGKLFVMNDDINLYLAVKFARPVVGAGNSASFNFDNNHDGGDVEIGDDAILYNPNPIVLFRDNVKSPCSFDPDRICAPYDTTVGGTNDGEGAFSNNGEFTVYEFSHPLNSADDVHDFNLRWGDTVGFNLSIRNIGDGGLVDTSFPAPHPSAPWSYGDIVILTPALVPVGIDIKPGEAQNTISLSSSGVIPVAIMSTEMFNATTVNPETISLAGAAVRLIGNGNKAQCAERDANGDGFRDLVCNVETVQFLIEDGESICVLEAETFDGAAVRGQDSVRIVH